MSIYKTAGTRLFVSPTSVVPSTINAMTDEDAIEFFDAINDWVEVEEVENFGDIGDSASPITFTAVKDRRVRKLKGPRDAGTQSIVVGRDPLDDGQEELIEAEGTDFNYAFKIELSDKQSDNFSNSLLYYAGLVMSKPTGIADVNAVTRRTFNVGINTGVYEVLSDALAVPVNVLKPSISGAAVQVGVTLTADVGTWTNSPTSFSYQWQHDASGNLTFSNVSVGGTSQTYVPVVGDVGDSLRVQVTATNGAGDSSVANSVATTVIIAA